MRTLFLTGASGFVGRRLLTRLAAGRYDHILAMSRRPQPPMAGVTWVEGDLADDGAWRTAIPSGADVAHLASATGAMDAARSRAVIIDGTRRVVRACEDAGAGGLLFVSSIAATFAYQADYPYATAKREAEAVVRASPVPHVIVRPTIILGPGSPILAKMRTLAGGPVAIVIGAGEARVQPVHVADCVAALERLLASRGFDGTTLEFGGPEVLTMEALLQRVRAARGRATGPVVHLPYGPLRAALRAAQALLGARSPVTAGQLTSFVQDGVAAAGPLWESLRPSLRTIDQMVRETDGG